MNKYLPHALALLFTLGGYFIERSILQTVTDNPWMSYGLAGFVFLLWVVALFVIVGIRNELSGGLFSEGDHVIGQRIVKLSD